MVVACGDQHCLQWRISSVNLATNVDSSLEFLFYIFLSTKERHTRTCDSRVVSRHKYLHSQVIGTYFVANTVGNEFGAESALFELDYKVSDSHVRMSSFIEASTWCNNWAYIKLSEKLFATNLSSNFSLSHLKWLSKILAVALGNCQSNSMRYLNTLSFSS